MRYPKLISNAIDSIGNLLECKIELANQYDSLSRDYFTILSISKGILIISNYQGDKRSDLHVFLSEQPLTKPKTN